MDVTERQVQCWDLQAVHYDRLKTLLDQSGKYEALEMKAAAAHGLTGWWYGSFENDQITNVAYITPQFVYVYGKSPESMLHLGKSLARSQGKGSRGKTHSVFGASDLVGAFWNGFQAAGKDLIADIPMHLVELTEVACKQNDAYTARFATKKDFALVFEFYGEALIDEVGMDVRKMSREAHEKNCQQLIAEGGLVLGFHRGKPAFISRTRESAVGLFLDHAFFPVAMRRPKVMRGIHARVAELLLPSTTGILMHRNASDEVLRDALEEVGYRTVHPVRLMRLR